MKRSILFIAFAALAVNAAAQTAFDAYTFSQENYVGTARSVALGNAMTALGGDLGSIVFNPAGSAIAGYSQFSLTPSVTVSTTRSQGTPLSGSTTPYGFEDPNMTRYARMGMPSFGATARVETGRKTGLKSWTVGLVGHMTNNYQIETYASGSNYNTTYAGFLSTLADGTSSNVLNSATGYDYADWRSVVGYQSNMIATYGGVDNRYIGVTEKQTTDGIGLADGINQYYGWLRYGNKYDILFNVGLNYNDRFFLGFNLGLSSLSMNSYEYWKEESITPSNFLLQFSTGETTTADTYFDALKMNYSYECSGSGAYLKTGFIWLPFQGLRLGAAIQTPTVYRIHEYYGYEGETTFTDASFNARANSGEGNYEYKVRSPFRLNAGLAYTIGKFGLISFDYEMCDYGSMKFSEVYFDDDFSSLNSDIPSAYGISHMLRAGFELRPLPQYAIRVGYNLTTDPGLDNIGNYVDANSQAVSFGLGYSSSGSFFADLACRLNYLPDDYFLVYPDYSDTILSPELCNRQTRFETLLTLGWRF